MKPAPQLGHPPVFISAPQYEQTISTSADCYAIPDIYLWARAQSMKEIWRRNQRSRARRSSRDSDVEGRRIQGCPDFGGCAEELRFLRPARFPIGSSPGPYCYSATLNFNPHRGQDTSNGRLSISSCG
jgi:hypothetical protein